MGSLSVVSHDGIVIVIFRLVPLQFPYSPVPVLPVSYRMVSYSWSMRPRLRLATHKQTAMATASSFRFHPPMASGYAAYCWRPRRDRFGAKILRSDQKPHTSFRVFRFRLHRQSYGTRSRGLPTNGLRTGRLPCGWRPTEIVACPTIIGHVHSAAEHLESNRMEVR